MLFNRRNFLDTPVISTTAYTASTQLGAAARAIGAANLASPFSLQAGSLAPIKVLRDDMGLACLEQVVVYDLAQQNQAMDIFFFNSLPVLANGDKGAFSMTSANFLASCIGSVNIPVAAYKPSAAQSIATVSVPSPGILLQGAIKSKDLWYLAVTRGTPTYGSASALTFNFGFNLP